MEDTKQQQDNVLHLLQEVQERVEKVEDALSRYETVIETGDVDQKIARVESSQTLQIHHVRQMMELKLHQLEEDFTRQITTMQQQIDQEDRTVEDDDDGDEGISYLAPTVHRQDFDTATFTGNSIVVASSIVTNDRQERSNEMVISSPIPIPRDHGDDDDYDLEHNESSIEQFQEHPQEIQAIKNDEDLFTMPIKNDMYSIMATTTPFTFPWCFSFCTFLIQVALFSMILIGQTFLSESKILDISPKFSIFVCVSQFLALLVLISIQDDIFDSIKMISLFIMDKEKERNLNDLVKSGTSFRNRRESLNLSSDSKMFWKLNVSRIIFPYFCKFIQGMLALITSFIIVIQSSDIISLFKDFAALSIISILDNSLFHYCEEGFLVGPRMQLEAKLVKNVRLKQPKNKLPLQHIIVALLLLSVYIPWGCLVQGQRNYAFYKLIYPQCDVLFDSQYDQIGDGKCDGSVLNTPSCNFDGNDCLMYNIAYPDCHASQPFRVGDNFCDEEYNVESCGYDGGDCCPLDDIRYGDGKCDGGVFNTAECLFDNGDCVDFNKKYPACLVPEPWRINDGICDGKEYFTEECGYDGGDCDRCTALNMKNAFLIGNSVCDPELDNEGCGHDGGDCGKEFFIRNVETNLAVSVQGDCLGDVTMQPFTGSNSQRFFFEGTNSRLIYSKSCERSVLDISYSNCKTENSKIELYQKHGYNNQLFEIYDGIITSMMCDKVLTPRGNESGASLYVDEDYGNDLQRWHIEVTFTSSNPTDIPTASPTNPLTASPTVTPCEINETEVLLDIQTDQWANEISWFLRAESGGTVADRSYSEDEGLSHFEHNFCLPMMDSCYEFSISDTYLDGILPPYGYNFIVNGTTLLSSFDNENGSFANETVMFGGSCMSV